MYFLVVAMSQFINELRIGYLYTYWGPLVSITIQDTVHTCIYQISCNNHEYSFTLIGLELLSITVHVMKMMSCVMQSNFASLVCPAGYYNLSDKITAIQEIFIGDTIGNL